jgi:hypothetical protein
VNEIILPEMLENSVFYLNNSTRRIKRLEISSEFMKKIGDFDKEHEVSKYQKLVTLFFSDE